MTTWKKYQGALVLDTSPHQEIQVNRINIIFNLIKSNALFARWTSNWDSSQKTEFWYVIKDSFISLPNLPAKNRSEINRGLKNYEVKKIDISYLYNNGYNLYKKAFQGYGLSNHIISEKDFKENFYSLINDHRYEFWGCFHKTTKEFVAYSQNIIIDESVSYSSIKFDPDHIKNYSGYALIYKMNEHYLSDMKYKFINDGARTISHETNIQEHLIRKHGFRRAYCKLNIIYHPLLWCVVHLLYPFRKKLRKNQKGFLKKINAVLLQEEIRLSF